MTVVGVRSQGSVAKNGALFFFERKNAALPGGMADETAGGTMHILMPVRQTSLVCAWPNHYDMYTKKTEKDTHLGSFF